MNFFAKYGMGMRALVYLRTLALNSTRIAIALESIARNDASRWERDNVSVRTSKLVELGTMDVTEVNRAWKAAHPELDEDRLDEFGL